MKPGNAVLLFADTVFGIRAGIAFWKQVFWNLNDHLSIALLLRGA